MKKILLLFVLFLGVFLISCSENLVDDLPKEDILSKEDQLIIQLMEYSSSVFKSGIKDVSLLEEILKKEKISMDKVGVAFYHATGGTINRFVEYAKLAEEYWGGMTPQDYEFYMKTKVERLVELGFIDYGELFPIADVVNRGGGCGWETAMGVFGSALITAGGVATGNGFAVAWGVMKFVDTVHGALNC